MDNKGIDFVGTLLCILVAVVGCIAVYHAATKDIEHGKMYYPMSMVVTVVNQDEDFVVIRDFNGQNWMFNGSEDWAVNDICACIMDTNGTDAIYDDIIVETKYCGWVGDKSAV